MLLKEAQEILKNKGYQLKKLNECGGFRSGSWGYRRPDKPSPDAEWIDGCGGGHWHVPTEQDKRRDAYNSKKHAAIGDKMGALKDELDELRSLRNKSISKQEAITIRECNKVLGQVLNKKLKATFKGSGWFINDIKVLNLNLEVGYSFVASTDDYSWLVTATRYVGGAYEREWYITCQAPKGQKISSRVEKNSSYYREQIKEYEKKLNDELDEILGNIKGFSTDYDTVKLDDRINAKEAELRKLSDDYDEENGWDKRRDEFKANLTPKGGLKKKIVRHESVEVADAKHLLESAGYICEVRTANTDDLYDAICSRGVDYEIAMEYVEGIDAEFMRRHQNIDELADECQMEYGY